MNFFFFKNLPGGAPGGCFLLPPGPFLLFENQFLSSRPIKKSSDKKDKKTKVVPLDEIYLEYGLRIELKPQIQPPEAKNRYLL